MSTQNLWPDNLTEARRYLLRNKPFYGLTIIGSATVFTEDMPTAATDGKSIFLNPKFIHRMPPAHLATVLAHEAIHIIRKDPDTLARKQWPDGTPLLDPAKFNIVADSWINGSKALGGEGCPFPTNIKPITNPEWDRASLTVRQRYDSLSDPPPQPPQPHGNDPDDSDGDGPDSDGDSDDSDDSQQQDSKGKPKDSSPTKGKGGIEKGDDIIPHRLSPEEVTEQRIKVRQAYEAARSIGKVPAWAEQLIEEIKNPKLDYRSLIQAWLRSNADKQALSYRRLNHRYLPDFYAPTLTGESFGNLAIGLDTSGSVWSKAPEFLSEVNGILKQLSPMNTILVPFDTEPKYPTEFPAGETIETHGSYKLYGGGGTDFRCVFNYLADKPCDALIMLTDLQGDFPDTQPRYPVLWVSTEADQTAPFGTVVHANFDKD